VPADLDGEIAEDERLDGVRGAGSAEPQIVRGSAEPLTPNREDKGDDLTRSKLNR
jgi:hypothetical protein